MAINKKLYCNTLGCKLAYAVKGIFRLLQQKFAEENIDLTVEQFFILNILNNEEGLILQELAGIVDRDKSAVLRHIDGLEEHQYVARYKDSEDRRRKILLITKKGMKILVKAKEVEEQVNDSVTKHLDSDQKLEYQKNIEKIYENAISE